jgi:NADPH2:quinone reductase
MSAAVASGTRDHPIVTAPVASRRPEKHGRSIGSIPARWQRRRGSRRRDRRFDAALALQGKKVAMLGGAMYSQFRSIAADQCLPLPDEVSVAEGASAFVNPMTALGMVDTMRSEGHSAIVHTAAASNLGQMLHRLCAAENIKLVNIVRSEDQERLLRGNGGHLRL